MNNRDENTYSLERKTKNQALFGFIGWFLVGIFITPTIIQDLTAPSRPDEPPLARIIKAALTFGFIPAITYYTGYLCLYKNNCTYTFKDETLEVTRFGKIIKSFQKSEIVNMELSDYLLTARIRLKDGSTLRCERTIEDYKDFIAHLESWSSLKMENKNYEK